MGFDELLAREPACVGSQLSWMSRHLPAMVASNFMYPGSACSELPSTSGFIMSSEDILAPNDCLDNNVCHFTIA